MRWRSSSSRRWPTSSRRPPTRSSTSPTWSRRSPSRNPEHRMDTAFLALIVIVLVALAFDYTNGFHDAANAIAVAVSTKALTPRVALALAAVMNLVGALLSTEVAKTVGAGIIDPPQG